MNINFNAANQYQLNSNFGKINYATNNATQATAEKENGTNFSPESHSLTISSAGKAMSVVDSLNKQKASIEENKNALIAKTLEEGNDISTIEKELEMYEEQLMDIDEQILTTINEEREKESHDHLCFVISNTSMLIC